MTSTVDKNNPSPCPECHGSGYQAMGCNLFPCAECSGSGTTGTATDSTSSKDGETSSP